jgi:predicted methyltransferase
LEAAYTALRPGGVLAVWSAAAEPVFTQRLYKLGFTVEERKVRAHAGKQGARHTIWLATRPG